MPQPIYVEVDASIVNGGIMTMDTSGSEGGDTSFYFINWSNPGGFSGYGWFWGDPNVPLSGNWASNPISNYEGSEDGFLKYMEENSPDNLNQWLGESWSNDMKLKFLQENRNTVFMNCVTAS